MDFNPGDVLRIRTAEHFNVKGEPGKQFETDKGHAVTLVVVLGEEPLVITPEQPREDPQKLMSSLGYVNVGSLPRKLKESVAAILRRRNKKE